MICTERFNMLDDGGLLIYRGSYDYVNAYYFASKEQFVFVDKGRCARTRMQWMNFVQARI